MVDDDLVVEFECHDEAVGAGQKLGAETDEGDSVLADQSAGSSGKAQSQSDHSSQFTTAYKAVACRAGYKPAKVLLRL